jgi:hypothetical protein
MSIANFGGSAIRPSEILQNRSFAPLTRDTTLAVDESALRHACVVVAGDHQVIAHRNPDDLPRLDKLPGNGQILFARFGIPAGVVVNDDQCGGRALDGNAEDLPGMDQAGIKRPACDGDLADHPVA